MTKKCSRTPYGDTARATLNLPKKYSCDDRKIQHCINCIKGEFITLRHNNIRDLTANVLQEVCKDVAVEPTLQRLTGEELLTTTKTGEDVLLSEGFLLGKRPRSIFRRKGFNPSASRYLT